MDESIAIAVSDVSKKFRLFNSPRQRLIEALHPFKKKLHREFWALQGVSFEVPKGATVGIVGRNGSGKSTLLQVICSVLHPTSGSVVVNGRISALLELGAGFNLELTGRANVFLNGTVMGLSRDEIKERLPLIEDFADIGEFFDQPVKTYSSGMFVRLAFATAINVDPDILIIDEALAVGDAKFQHKCFGKFLDFQKAHKTILFVSHSTESIVKHCDYAVLLEKGRLIEKGQPRAITDYYLDLLFTGQIAGYAIDPVLVEDGYRGFNIVHFKFKYYGFLSSLGHIELNSISDTELQGYMLTQRCVVGSSDDEVREMIDLIVNASEPESAVANLDVPAGEQKETVTELSRFLEEIPAVDKCVTRNSYNKNEYRITDGRGRIVDYLVVCDGRYDPVSVKSGSLIDIYLKARFSAPVEQLIYGFALKTLDGVLVHGNNTRLARHPVSAAEADQVVVFRFSLRMAVQSGDVFLDLGVAERLTYEDKPVDVRYGLIHLSIQQGNVFTGMADLNPTFEEIR
ncbi:ABC transporter ATP-binding protein [Candidatus Magnetobacterium casense]|uniref:ABC transporter ATP-binding protein n=1 Tax=Candidatus Magnetobacterium casense TaxID=1455061 RepID=A0ABS6RZU6_9BACT|nr:ABC transporter ATP-binding protein [Candidatus Magnetobacterium casensis]MBV6342140.1 ABC transporter ATP-binding protein [Candidatus Magnetobacterium casensis]